MEEKRSFGKRMFLTVLEWVLIFAAATWCFRWSWRNRPITKERYEQANALWSSSSSVYGTAKAQGKAGWHMPGLRTRRVLLIFEAEGVQQRVECEMENRSFVSLDKQDGLKDGVASLSIHYDRADPTRVVTEQTLELAKKQKNSTLVLIWVAGMYMVGELLLAGYFLVASIQESADRRKRAKEAEHRKAMREERLARERAQRERERKEKQAREQREREEQARREREEQARREQEANERPSRDSWTAALNDALHEAEQRQSDAAAQDTPGEETVFDSSALSVPMDEPETQWEDSGTRPEDDAGQDDGKGPDNATVWDSGTVPDNATVWDSGTVPDNATVWDSATVPDNATIPESGINLSDQATLCNADSAGDLSDSARRGDSVSKSSASDGPVPSDTLQKGSTLLDTYRIESDSLDGGMGSVWRVHHLHWDMDMAMKRALPEAYRTEAQRELFVKECENWINLGLHPNIVTCYYVREVEGMPTAFSEWIENGSLRDRMEDKALYQGTAAQVQARLLDIAIQFARGLAYAHRQKLTHKDVKPDNVLLTRDWEARVSDFGLTGSTGGFTPAYCSPEQAAHRKPSRKTDLYSWAATVLEMYLGRRPWKLGPMAGAACQDYFALSDPAAELPADLKPLLSACLDAETKNRPRDFAAVERELKRIYQAVTGTPYPRPAPRAVQEGADILNNRALSYLDLGKPEEAQQLWLQAALQEPAHTETLFNRTLYAYRNGSLSLYEAQCYLSSNWENHFNEAAPGLLLAELSAEGRDIVNLRDVTGYIRNYSSMQETLSEQVLLKLMQLEALAIGMSHSGEFCYRCSYQISRVRNIAEWEALDKARDDALREMKQKAKKGNWNDAALQLTITHLQHELGDALYQPDWMAFYEELYRHCMPVHVLAQWPIQTVSAVSDLERVSFSDDSRLFLCGQRLYDLQTGTLLADHRGAGEAVRCSGLSPDGRFYLRTAEDDTVVERVDARTGAVLSTMEGHDDAVLSLAISRDGQCLATGDAAGVLRLWDAEGRNSHPVEFMETSGQPLRDIQFGYDRDKMVLRYDGVIVIRDGDAEPRMLPCFKFFRVALDLSFVHMVMGEGNWGMSVFDLNQNQKLELTAETDERQPHGITSPSQVCFMQNDRFLLVSQKKLLFFFDPVTAKILSGIHTAGPLRTIAASRNGKYIAYTCDGKAHLWRCIYGLSCPGKDTREHPDLLDPCAWVQSAAAPEESPEALADGLIDELAERGGGLVSRETALSALRQARERQRARN